MHNPGLSVYLFGSYARGEEKLLSDLDLAVHYRKRVGLSEELRLSWLGVEVLGGGKWMW